MDNFSYLAILVESVISEPFLEVDLLMLSTCNLLICSWYYLPNLLITRIRPAAENLKIVLTRSCIFFYLLRFDCLWR